MVEAVTKSFEFYHIERHNVMYSDRDRHKRDVDERTKDKIEYKLLTMCLVNNNPRYGINFNINYFTSKILAQHV